MNVLYNSEHYYVVEFPGLGGIELVDKSAGRGGFLAGAVEVRFRATMADFARTDIVARRISDSCRHRH